jgi:hypothetical protein
MALEFNRPSSTDKMALVGPTDLKFSSIQLARATRKMKILLNPSSDGPRLNISLLHQPLDSS